jgi:DNA polymerase-3 subunit alpha
MAEKETKKKVWTEDDEYLRFKTLLGFHRRGLPMTEEYRERLAFEGDVICQTDFAPYFLIVADLCDFMRSRGIRFVVRGSGCGCLHVWGLGISHKWLDPIKLKLPFERFLNPSRVSNPDLDIDIQDDRRHEVVEYTIQKYGKDRVARIITFGTLGAKAAIKDVGRALDVPNHAEISDRISDAIPGGKVKISEALEGSEMLRQYAEHYPKWFEMAQRCEGKTRHASIHAAGVIIAPDSLTNYLPCYFKGNPEKRNPEDWEPTTQWDMYDCEKRGLLKMDYLGLKTLRVMEDAVKLINDRREQLGQPRDFDIDEVSQKDPNTWKLLSEGKLAGVFQVERQFVRNFARRMNLMAMDPWRLAILISIIRPGMMDTGMTEEYLRRANGEAPPTPPHPKLENTLKENFGCFVFQEDCMWATRDFAGFNMSEADNLRRAIGKKQAEEMAKIKPDFLRRAVELGVTVAEAEDVWSKMESFARYGFNNAHAAAYGVVVAYQTAYLKANHPLAYMTALINSENGVGDKDRGYNAKVAEYIEEARGMGINITPPCVKLSGPLCTIDWDKNTIRFGLEMIKQVGVGSVRWIMEKGRHVNSFRDFVLACYEVSEQEVVKKGQPAGPKEWKSGVRVGKTDVVNLIKAGALDVFDPNRDRLLALYPGLSYLADKYWKQTCKVLNGRGARLIDTPEKVMEKLRKAHIEEDKVQEATLEDKLELERSLTGCFLSDKPFTPFYHVISEYQTCTAADVAANEFEDLGTFAGMLRDYRTTVIKNGKNMGKEMAFMTFSGYSCDAEVVAFSDAWAGLNAPRADGEPNVKLERGKVYLIRVKPDRNGKSAVLDSLMRLSNSAYST